MTQKNKTSKYEISGHSLIEMLESAALNSPQKGILIVDANHNRERRTYKEISDASRKAAAGWEKWVEKGDRILFSLPTGFDFLVGFFGALRIGAIPVPLAPPRVAEDASDRAEFLARVAVRIQAKAALLELGILNAAKPPELGILERALDISELLHQGEEFTAQENDIAFIQTTSGTTGTRRGVLLSHRAILKNLKNTGKRMGIRDDDVTCSWLPMYNVLGLIGGALFSIYHGLECILIDPERFIEHPHEWLTNMSRYKATLTVAPSHAYHFVARRSSKSLIETLDLSSLRIALVGGEPIRPSHLQSFAEVLNKAHLNPQVFSPGYGLSEATMCVTASPRLSSLRVSRSSLENEGEVVVIEKGKDLPPHEVLEFVSNGTPIKGVEVMITDSRGVKLACNRLGEIAIKSQTLMEGYFLKDVRHTRTSGSWLLSDDVGFLHQGELYVVARKNEIITTPDGGQLFAHELEYSLENIDGIRPGCITIFRDKAQSHSASRYLVVAIENEPGADHQFIKKKILEVLYQSFRVRPQEICIFSPNSIPRSPNGKVRRELAKTFFEKGILEKEHRREEFAGVRKLVQRTRHSLWKWIRKRGDK